MFIIKGGEIRRGVGEEGMGLPCSLGCFLLSRDVNIFGDPRKVVCWPRPGRAGCFIHCPGSEEPFRARKVQAAVGAVCEVRLPGDADFGGPPAAGLLLCFSACSVWNLKTRHIDSGWEEDQIKTALEWRKRSRGMRNSWAFSNHVVATFGSVT